LVGYRVFVFLLLFYQLRVNFAWSDYTRAYLDALRTESKRFDLAGPDKNKFNCIQVGSSVLSLTPLFEVFKWPWSDPALSIALRGGELNLPVFCSSSYTDYLYYQDVAKWLKQETNFK